MHVYPLRMIEHIAKSLTNLSFGSLWQFLQFVVLQTCSLIITWQFQACHQENQKTFSLFLDS